MVSARRAKAAGPIATIGTVLGLVAALGLTVFGLGAADHAVAGYDASSWLWSSTKGEVARVNGVTGRVDTRYRVPDTIGHTMQVTQTDRYLLLRDQQTGLVSAVDLATLQIAATTPTTAGLGVKVALHDDAAFVIDAVQGIVRQLDPLTLQPVGEPMRFPPGIAGGAFDGQGRLWLAVPTEGTVVSLRPAATRRTGGGRDNSGNTGNAGGGRDNSGGAGGEGGSITAAGPREDRTVPVAEPNHDLVLSALDDGVAVLDRTTNALTTLRGAANRTVVLDLSGPGGLPTRTSGADVPVTIVDDRHVYVVNGDRVHDFTVPGAAARLRPCVAWAGRFYCPDEATGKVYALGPTGQLLTTIETKGGAGPLELEVREQRLFINAPNTATAHVVDDKHKVRAVDKYANNILGGDPPPPAPPAPPPKPALDKPSAPGRVTASAGNASARVTWTAATPNGSPIQRYVVEGGPAPVTVGANQRSIEITGLVNGTTYRFTVHAVNAKGAGPKRTSNPVVPTSNVPDPPVSVTATANPDGTVTVAWPAANGQGRKILRYVVSAVSAAGTEIVGEPTTNTLRVPAGPTGGTALLDFGTQYAFTVVAVNDLGAGSKPSPPSGSIVPYAKPGAPRNLTAATVANQRGQVRATWQPAADNGRPITKYVVTAAGRSQDVTGTTATLSGFGDGVTVQISVTAVNAAGAGPAATATARTVGPPSITITGTGSTHTSISVALSVNGGGGQPGCTISVGNSPPVGFPCGGGTVGGVWPNNGYGVTVTVTNVVGSAQASTSVNTLQLAGRVVCTVPSYCGPQSPDGEGIWLYSVAHQTDNRAVGDEFAGFSTLARCWTTDTQGTTINATPYGGKRSNIWIRVDYRGGTAYIPYAWFRLDAGETGGGAPSGILPGC